MLHEVCIGDMELDVYFLALDDEKDIGKLRSLDDKAGSSPQPPRRRARARPAIPLQFVTSRHQHADFIALCRSDACKRSVASVVLVCTATTKAQLMYMAEHNAMPARSTLAIREAIAPRRREGRWQPSRLRRTGRA